MARNMHACVLVPSRGDDAYHCKEPIMARLIPDFPSGNLVFYSDRQLGHLVHAVDPLWGLENFHDISAQVIFGSKGLIHPSPSICFFLNIYINS